MRGRTEGEVICLICGGKEIGWGKWNGKGVHQGCTVERERAWEGGVVEGMVYVWCNVKSKNQLL